MTTQSKSIRTITVTEVALNDHYPVADVMMDGMGFGRPLDFEPMLKTPGFIEMAWKAPIALIAEGLGVEVDEVRGSLDRRLTDRDIEVAFGTIPAGTCGAVRTRAAGVVDGREAIVVEHIIRMARDVGAGLADVGVRRDLPRGHRGRPRHSLRDDVGGGGGSRRGSRRDGVDRDAGRQRGPVRGRGAGGAAQLTRHVDDVAAVRIRVCLESVDVVRVRRPNVMRNKS